MSIVESKFDKILDTLIEIRDLMKSNGKLMRDLIKRRL